MFDDCLPHLDVGSGRRFGPLTLFPLWSDARTLPGMRWSLKDVAVGELADGPAVGRLQVVNRSPHRTALIEGDLLEGGLQHRMAARTVVLDPFEHASLDVLCVEAGRWDGGSMSHRAGGARGTLRVRAASRQGDERRQGEVWERIRRYDAEYGMSATSSMLDHLARSSAPELKPMPGQRGVVIGVGGRILGLELFGSSRALSARWAGLVRAAWIDARPAPAIATTSSQARSFVRHLSSVPLDLGAADRGFRPLRFEDGRLRVAGLTAVGDRLSPMHLTAFDDAHPLLEAA